MIEQTSWCSRCQRDLSVSMFHVSNSRPSGYQGNCKTCVKEIQDERKQRLADLEALKNYHYIQSQKRVAQLEEFIRDHGLTPPDAT